MIKFKAQLVFTCLFNSFAFILPQEIDYLKMIDMEIGSSVNEVKNKWENGELSEYGFLKVETFSAREQFTMLKYRDRNKEFTFICDYKFKDDSLFSYSIMNKLELEEAKRYEKQIRDKFDLPFNKSSLSVDPFSITLQKDNGLINTVSFGIESTREKITLSITINNQRMAKENWSRVENYSPPKDSLNGFHEIVWKSSWDQVIKKMKSYEGTKIDSAFFNSKLHFIGGTFIGMKVRNWIFSFYNDMFYNLVIVFDSTEKDINYSNLEKCLINDYGDNFNYTLAYEIQKGKFEKTLLWYFRSVDEETISEKSPRFSAFIYFKSCCDEDNPRAQTITYNFVPISRMDFPNNHHRK
jgi:hypothetical protein